MGGLLVKHLSTSSATTLLGWLSLLCMSNAQPYDMISAWQQLW
jgi:hypothetical protein